MRLLEYLNFGHSKDSDWLLNSKVVLCFSKNEEYEIFGLSHGIESHALKHLIEYKPSLIRNLVKSIIEKLKTYEGNIYILKKDDKKIIKFDDFKNQIEHFKDSQNIIINTLDFINDKIVNNIKLLPIERELDGYLKEFKVSYERIIEEKISKSIDLDNVYVESFKKYSSDVIQFTAKDKRHNRDQKIYFDFKDKTFIAKRENKIWTMFQLDKPNNEIASYMLRKYYFKNQSLEQAFRNYG